MVESSPSRQRRPPYKISKGTSDEAADAAAHTYLLTVCGGRCDADHVTTFSSISAPSCARCCTAASGTKTCPETHTHRSLVRGCGASWCVRKRKKPVLILLRRWKTITCYDKFVEVANVWVCKPFPRTFVQRMQQRLTRRLAADRICMAHVPWEPDRVSTIATSWPRRLPSIPPPPTQPLGYDYYRILGHSMLDALIDPKMNPTDHLKGKLDAVVGRRRDMDADRQEAATQNVR